MNIRSVSLDQVWRMRKEIMYPDSTIEEVKLRDDEAGLHLGLYAEEQLLSVISVFERGNEIQFRKFATRTDMQGKGYGSLLLQHVMQLAEEKGVERIWCNARFTATKLYEKFSMQATGNSWRDKGHNFIIMEKKIKKRRMEVIPAIDIIEGKCVRLVQGDYAQKKVYNENPVEVAQAFEGAGLKRLHLVDLDGAKAKQVKNWKVLETIAARTKMIIDFGGGITTAKDVSIVFDSGAQYATVGSIAVKQEEEFTKWLLQFGSDRFLLGADVKARKISIHGWLEDTTIDVMDFIDKYYKKGVQQVFCTDVSKDGKLEGPSLELYKEIVTRFSTLNFIASGGVASLEDLDTLQEIGCSGAIVGKAIYENKISLTDLKKYV